MTAADRIRELLAARPTTVAALMAMTGYTASTVYAELRRIGAVQEWSRGAPMVAIWSLPAPPPASEPVAAPEPPPAPPPAPTPTTARERQLAGIARQRAEENAAALKVLREMGAHRQPVLLADFRKRMGNRGRLNIVIATLAQQGCIETTGESAAVKGRLIRLLPGGMAEPTGRFIDGVEIKRYPPGFAMGVGEAQRRLGGLAG